jgi:hypothetical protein
MIEMGACHQPALSFVFTFMVFLLSSFIVRNCLEQMACHSGMHSQAARAMSPQLLE